MTIKEYTNSNREAWNEVTPKHQAARNERLDKSFSTPGYIIQRDKQLLSLFDKIQIKGKDVIHLCCNNGIELLSIKNMGAGRCVGVDISDLAVDEANNRAKESNIDCEYICSDVYEIPEQFYNSFDVLHITAGCIGWMPDLELFFNICNKLLRKNGMFLIHEIHPFSELLPFDDSDIGNRLQIVDKYFYSEPLIENSGLDYVGGTEYEAKTTYWFIHTVSKLVMSLISNKFEIEEFLESTSDISGGHGKIESLKAEIPLSMLILGRKIDNK
ncbi:MAG: class I SAM-dependent methyltransferase [bacterium]|nr:class I SAM-dependent methyltransferase [bacterium]